MAADVHPTATVYPGTVLGDGVKVLEHAVVNDTPGVFNVAGDGVLVLSEVASLLGKPLAPILPPWGAGVAAAVMHLSWSLGFLRETFAGARHCPAQAGEIEHKQA